MTYADNLRAIGCDEDTIARYVWADTLQMFANRERYMPQNETKDEGETP